MTLHVDHDEARAAFRQALDAFVACVSGWDDRALLAASRCTGWTTGDVVVHVHLALQEMLLGLVSTTGETPGTDAASYWRSALPTNDDEADELDGLRFVRLLGSAYRRPSGAVRHLRPTAEGVRTATAALRPGAVRFQGHVLSTGDFLATWAVELAVHHLDLHRTPPAPALRLARRTVESLAGGPLPPAWTDATVVLAGSGRTGLTPRQRTEAGGAADVFPVLG